MTMKMSDAEVIEIYRNSRDTWGNFKTPEGWKYLGAGVFRTAYMGPDGWVYKIGSRQCNENDVLRFGELYPHSDSNLRFPYAEMVYDGDNDYNSIVRVEYIDGEWKDAWEWGTKEWQKMRQWIMDFVYYITGERVTDLHHENICFVDGTPVVIDLG